MKKLIFTIAIVGMALLLNSCSENYSNGERIGVITRFSQKGLIFKSWELNLNVTQTGMNTSGEPFECSVDNNNEDKNLISELDSAANKGWKVKIIYHQCKNRNMTGSRGETDYFIDELVVLDKHFTEKLQFNSNNEKAPASPAVTGKVIDTIYVVIDKSELKK